MNSLATALVQGKPTPERRKQAEVWLRKALHVIDETKTAAKGQNPNNANNTYSGIPEELSECEMTLAVALFNLGELREVRVFFPFTSPSPFSVLDIRTSGGFLVPMLSISLVLFSLLRYFLSSIAMCFAGFATFPYSYMPISPSSYISTLTT